MPRFDLDDDSVGMLTSWPLALFYVTCGIPISWIADRSNRRNALGTALMQAFMPARK